MNNCTPPTCTVKTVRQGPWFLLSLEVKIPRGLPMKDHADFCFDRQFAGLSPRGIPLSVKGSTSPAEVGTIPLVPEKPQGWQALPHFADAGLLVLTPSPRFAFFGINDAGWGERCTSLCIHPDDLATNVVVPDQKSQPQPSDLRIDKLTSDLVNLLARHDQRLKVVLFGNYTYLRMPTSLRLNRTDWAALKRHLFTRHSFGTFLETTEIGKIEGCFKLPGHSMDEVKARWGVGEDMPCVYDGKHLCFHSLHVLQGDKLGLLHPNAEMLEGRHLDLARSGGRYADPMRRILDLSHNEYALSLSQALDAGIVPPNGILHVDPSIETIRLPADSLRIGDFKGPVIRQGADWEEPNLFCPHHLMAQFLLPARQAVRMYTIPDNIKPFRVRTQNASDGDPAGKYYLLTDLQTLAPRDLKHELAERRARHKRLVDRHGSALPDGHERLTDEQIEVYFEIQDLVQAGEIVQAEQHPLMPSSFRARTMLDWIQKEAPHLVKTCPVTKQIYVCRLEGFEDLVALPGFWHAVESAVGEGAWLRRLVTCPKVQAAALISAI